MAPEQDRLAPASWHGSASPGHADVAAPPHAVQQLRYWPDSALTTVAGFPTPHKDIPVLQATVILEGCSNLSCSTALNSAANSSSLDCPDGSSMVTDIWSAAPAPLARSTSDVTSSNSSTAAGSPAPLMRSISDVTSHISHSSRSAQVAPAQQSSPQQQQCRPARQRLLLIQQLHARAKPAATASALHLAGRWWHQDAHQLSELLLMPDGTMAWLRQSRQVSAAQAGSGSGRSAGITSSMAAAASRVRQLLSTNKQQQTAAAAATASCTEPVSCSWSLQPYECVAEWRGSWRLAEGNARRGKLLLTFLASALEERQHGSVCTRNQQQKQQQAEVSFQRGALEDVLLLDGVAHMRSA